MPVFTGVFYASDKFADVLWGMKQNEKNSGYDLCTENAVVPQ